MSTYNVGFHISLFVLNKSDFYQYVIKYLLFQDNYTNYNKNKQLKWYASLCNLRQERGKKDMIRDRP